MGDGPKAQTGFLFKVVGLLLVLVAGYIGYYFFTKGKVVDLTDPNELKKLGNQAAKDATAIKDKTVEATRKFTTWAQASISDLQERYKVSAPATKEESSQLVKETKDQVAVAPPAPPPAATLSKKDLLIQQANEEYRLGQKEYAGTDPVSVPSDVIQKQLKLAEPHFVKTLDLLENARKEGASGGNIDHLEQAAAKRLIDTRRRIEQKFH